MAINARNYKKNPHTARWLMTFHTAGAGLPADVEESAATEFVSGGNAQSASTERRTALNARNTEIFIKGWRILTGPGLITEKQAKWVVDIAETKAGVTDAMVASLAERLTQGFTRQAASEFITKYKDLPRREQEAFSAAKAEAIVPGATDEEVVVPAGRYALRGEDGVVKFYRLDRPTQGKWAGYTFLKVQASDDLYLIRNRAERDRIIAEIAKDTLAAEQLYGRELGKCSRCGRTLTDETSRAYGIGPDCRSKY
jgi:hypothetical protein